MADTATSKRPEKSDQLTDRNAPEVIADEIAKKILMREISIGQRLVEADLMRDFVVGRSTVREALRILGAQGVVELTRHRGAVVRVLSTTDAAHLLQVLEVLSGLCARLAAANINRGTNRRRLMAVIQRVTQTGSSQELSKIVDERARFHQVLFDIADNQELNRALPTARSHLFRNQFYSYLTIDDINSMADEYQAIADAVLKMDGDGAELAMRRHISKTAERTLPRVKVGPITHESDDLHV